MAEVVARYPDYYKIGITNQEIGINSQYGVAIRKKTLEQVIAEQKITMQLLPELHEIYFCPDFEGLECYQLGRIKDSICCWQMNSVGISNRWCGQYRKPSSGMIEMAINEILLPVDRQECLFVGDRLQDQSCAEAANIPFMWAEKWRKD